ncbi:MAG: cytochrome c oxidase subunit II [Nitriliruptoraceae bacterium]|nr:cytochrome c oxidase subunit II [Nitriliruptoraceae bacterium]
MPDPRRSRHARHLVLASAVAVLAACDQVRDATTDPASPQAADLDGLWSLSLWMGVAVWVLVMALLATPVLRSWRRSRREGAPDDPRSGPADHDPTRAEGSPVVTETGSGPRTTGIFEEALATADPALAEEAQADVGVHRRLLWWGGIILPAVILVVLLIASGRVGVATAHLASDEPDEVVVEVVGHMFWWEVRYPDHDIVTANEVVVPVDTPVRLVLTSADVIHSYWIPRLHGKVDMMPGQENWLTFTADTTGRFRGNCAEFCGIAHAQMVAYLDVVEQDEYEAWLANEAADARDPDTPTTAEGSRVFTEVGCAACHAVRGTSAVAGVGPDLTHLASRGHLAAGIVPNTRDNLERLIVDPWGLKPGNPMPPTNLDQDQLDALLDYLEHLE